MHYENEILPSASPPADFVLAACFGVGRKETPCKSPVSNNQFLSA